MKMTMTELNQCWREYQRIPHVLREERFGQWVYNRFAEEGETANPELFYARDRDAYKMLEHMVNVQ